MRLLALDRAVHPRPAGGAVRDPQGRRRDRGGADDPAAGGRLRAGLRCCCAPRDGPSGGASTRPSRRAGCPTARCRTACAVIFGGAFLITPGFITDIVGLALLLPPTRSADPCGSREALIARRMSARITVAPARRRAAARLRRRGHRHRAPAGRAAAARAVSEPALSIAFFDPEHGLHASARAGATLLFEGEGSRVLPEGPRIETGRQRLAGRARGRLLARARAGGRGRAAGRLDRARLRGRGQGGRAQGALPRDRQRDPRDARVGGARRPAHGVGDLRRRATPSWRSRAAPAAPPATARSA